MMAWVRKSNKAEIELQRLQRQYRIMEGDRKAYSEESRILIGKQRVTIEKLKKDNEYLQDELKLLEQRNEDRRKNGIQSKKAESMAEQAGKFDLLKTRSSAALNRFLDKSLCLMTRLHASTERLLFNAQSLAV
jgi:hypothetical protein